MSAGFVVSVAVEDQKSRRIREVRHAVKWFWLARLIAWTYVYGSVFVRPYGADVIDVFIVPEHVA